MEKYKKVKTAVIGCGNISDIYIRNLKNLFEIIDLVALCDLNRDAVENRAKRFGVDKIMTSDEIAADNEIELVVNLTDPSAHYPIIKQMLESGKHVYTEKMFTTKLEDAKALLKIADEKGLMIGVAPDTVLGAGLQTARNIIDKGFIGNVTSGVVSVTRNQNLNSEFFRFLQKNGGALPYDVGIYYIGSLISLLGSVKTVKGLGKPALLHDKEILYAKGNPDIWQIPGNNVVAAALEFECGALVTLHFNGNTAGFEHKTFELYGTKGMLRLGDPNQFDGYVKLVLPESPECELPFTHGYNGKNLLSEPAPYDFYGHRGVGIADLAYAIRQGRYNRLSKEYGLHCQEVLYGIDLSAETGETYTVESKCNVFPLKSGYFSTTFNGTERADAELSLM